MKTGWISQNWDELIVAFGVIYGVIMSTYNFIESKKKKRRIVKVKVSHGWLPSRASGLGEEKILIKVYNPGERAVTVNLPFLRLPRGESIVTPIPIASVQFPFELQEGKDCTLFMGRRDVEESLIKRGYVGKISLFGMVDDLIGNEYKSRKPLKLEIKEEKG